MPNFLGSILGGFIELRVGWSPCTVLLYYCITVSLLYIHISIYRYIIYTHALSLSGELSQHSQQYNTTFCILCDKYQFGNIILEIRAAPLSSGGIVSITQCQCAVDHCINGLLCGQATQDNRDVEQCSFSLRPIVFSTPTVHRARRTIAFAFRGIQKII